MFEFKIREFYIKNFKSLKDITLKLNNFNVIVGRNASGKTNIVEAFKLFRDVYHYRYDIPFFNPFYEWGGYQNVVWQGNEELPIQLGFRTYIEDYDVYYEKYITGYGGRFEILKERLFVKGYVDITIEGNKLIIMHDSKFIEKIWNKIKSLSKSIFSMRYLKEALSEKESITFQEYELLERRLGIMSGWSATYTNDSSTAVILLHIPVKNERFPIIISPTIKIKRKIQLRLPRRIELKEEIRHVPLVTYIFSSEFISQSQILILRQLNYKAITTPQPVRRELILKEDGSNLANVLLTLYSDRGIPERIVRVINSIFGNVEIKPKITDDGRVYIEILENGLKLQPKMVSDGFWKLLTILTAIELNPHIIVIDELENSLHPEAIEYVVDELKNSKSIVIVTTHSPAVVDIIDPKDLILLEKDVEGKTIVKRIENPEKIKKWLSENGITLSEGWLYGDIF